MSLGLCHFLGVMHGVNKLTFTFPLPRNLHFGSSRHPFSWQLRDHMWLHKSCRSWCQMATSEPSLLQDGQVQEPEWFQRGTDNPTCSSCLSLTLMLLWGSQLDKDAPQFRERIWVTWMLNNLIPLDKPDSSTVNNNNIDLWGCWRY